jgi:hypothetical protein
MNGVDPQAWLTDIIARIAAHLVHRPTNYYPGIGSSHQKSPLKRQGVTTTAQVAKTSTKDEDWLRDVSIEMGSRWRDPGLWCRRRWPQSLH